MHDDPPPSPGEGEYQPAPQPTRLRNATKSGWKSAGGIAVGAGMLAAKFKGALLLLANFKWLFFVPKFALSFGLVFASLWLYATWFGWKLGIVFVLLIVVHEMGHWVVIRGFGGQVSLPYLLPGLGAFVAQKSPLHTADQDAYAALAGPILGVAASTLCWAYGLGTHNPFWTVAAYLGFFMNLFNLIPALPMDGGRVAGLIDPRLWIAGVIAFVAFIVAFHAFGPLTILFLILIGFATIPRIQALRRGYIDPRVIAVPVATRRVVALSYFATIVVAGIGTFATYITNR